MPNFILTRDDFEKLGRVKEWDDYEDDNERTMSFFWGGVMLTPDELSRIGHAKDYRVIQNETKMRIVRDEGKPFTPELERMYNIQERLIYYPPKKYVARAIWSFCDSLTELIAKCTSKIKSIYKKANIYIDVVTEGYDFVIFAARFTTYALDQDTSSIHNLFGNLFFFRDKLVELESNLEDLELKRNESGFVPIPISGEMFARIAFVCNAAIHAYNYKATKLIQNLRDGETDTDEKDKRFEEFQNEMDSWKHNTRRELESDHQGALTQIMAWRLAQAVLNDEIDFAEYLANNDKVLLSISKNYGRKSEELDKKAEKVRKEFYELIGKEPPEQTYTICIRRFKDYLDFSNTPASNGAEIKKPKKLIFREIPALDNSPSNFVNLLKERLNKKNRKKRRKL